jgi:hypothetical protein
MTVFWVIYRILSDKEYVDTPSYRLMGVNCRGRIDLAATAVK